MTANTLAVVLVALALVALLAAAALGLVLQSGLAPIAAAVLPS